MESLLKVEEAAKILGISQWTVRAYIRDRKFTNVHIGRRVLLDPPQFVNSFRLQKIRTMSS